MANSKDKNIYISIDKLKVFRLKTSIKETKCNSLFCFSLKNQPNDVFEWCNQFFVQMPDEKKKTDALTQLTRQMLLKHENFS